MLQQQPFVLAVGLAAALALGGCARTSPNSKAKVQQVTVGMSVQQVDQILGTPVSVLNTPTLPTAQIREYEGYRDQGGDHDLFVHFDKGTVTRVVDMIPKKSHW